MTRTANQALNRSLAAYVKGPLTPDAATRFQQDIWRARGEEIGVSFEVTPCAYSAKELADLTARGRGVSYLPPEVASQGSRHILGLIFPKMGCYSLHPDNVMTNDASPAGWFDYENSIDAPRTNTNEADLLDEVAAEGLALMSINQYIVASQDSRLVTGRYLDEQRSWARIGSRVTGRIVACRFDGDEMAEGLGDEVPVSGSLLSAYDLGDGDAMPVLGGRTAGAPAAQRVNRPDAPSDRVVERCIHPTQSRHFDPEVERARLVDLMVDSGFHAELGLPADEYIATLPQLGPQPSEYVGRLDIPLIVETRIPWKRQFEMTGIFISNFMTMFSDPVPASAAAGERDTPYCGWFNAWGQRFPDPISPDDARARLAPDEVGANLIEAAAMLLAYPELNMTGRFYDFVGSIVPPPEGDALLIFPEIARTGGACRWRGRPEFACNLHPDAFALFRPLIRGVVVTVLSAERS